MDTFEKNFTLFKKNHYTEKIDPNSQLNDPHLLKVQLDSFINEKEPLVNSIYLSAYEDYKKACNLLVDGNKELDKLEKSHLELKTSMLSYLEGIEKLKRKFIKTKMSYTNSIT